jgi:hypothetical protein
LMLGEIERGVKSGEILRRPFSKSVFGCAVERHRTPVGE